MKLTITLKKNIFPSVLALFAILLDQLTKALTVASLRLGETFPLIKGVFHFTYRRNTGAAWSLFDAPGERWIFMSISTVGILAMIAVLLLYKDLTPPMRYGLGMVIGGGIGNMIDRVRLGYVVDMLDARFINFPVFNVADSFICIGTGLLILAMILDWRDEVKREKTAAEKAEAED